MIWFGIRTYAEGALLSVQAANAFLAQRISSINAISAICEKVSSCLVLEFWFLL